MASVLSAPHFHDENSAFAYVEAHLWPSGPVCPHCGATSEKVGKLEGKTTRPGLYKCYACRKPFTVRMGTIFEDSHCPMRFWLQAIHLICASKKGISTRQLQRTLGVGMKTAWFLGHRIRNMMQPEGYQGPMGSGGGTVEADESFVGGKPENRPKRIRNRKDLQPKKQIVFSLVERDGRVRSFHVPNVTGPTLRMILRQQVSQSAHLRTDEYRGYHGRKVDFASHETVNHFALEYVRGDVHTNTVEGFFSILKRGIYGVYQHVSEAHLHRYLAEFDFRYSNRVKLGVDDVARASIALKGAKGKRLTYQTANRAKA